LTSLDSHLLLHDCHHTVGRDCGVDLDPDSILGIATVCFNLEMLLQPIEEQFDLPPVMVQFSDHQMTDIQPFVLGEGVREEDELPLVLLVPLNDSTDLVGVLSHGQLTIHIADCIRQYAGVGRKAPFQPHRSEVIVLFAADDEVGSNGTDPEHSREVVVASVKDVERVFLVRKAYIAFISFTRVSVM
jgi:hypothetical protein